MLRRMMIMLGVFVAVVAALGGYKAMQIKAMIKKFAAMKPPPVHVAVTTLQEQSWPQTIRAVGTLRALHAVDLGTEAPGLVTQVFIQSGSYVHKGQILVQLDDRQEKAQIDQGKAAVALAQSNVRRDQLQLKDHALAAAQLETDRAILEEQKAQLIAEQVALDKKAIHAPFDGRVGVVSVNPGQFINNGDHIAHLESVDPVLVDFSLPQSQIPAVHLHDPIDVQVDVLPGQKQTGSVLAFDSDVDQVTRNIVVEGDLSSDRGRLIPGMFARVSIQTGDPVRWLTLPQTAVVFHPYGNVVFVTDHPVHQGEQAKVHQVFIKLGDTQGDRVAVLQGIKPGETVVTLGGQLLKNGDTVQVDQAHAPSQDPTLAAPNEE